MTYTIEITKKFDSGERLCAYPGCSGFRINDKQITMTYEGGLSAIHEDNIGNIIKVEMKLEE